MTTDDFAVLLNDPVVCAKRLLGCEFVMQYDTASIRLKIVETEAYHQSDAASHSYRGKTPRTDVMFGPPGHLYVYFTYGMHYCMNVVTGAEGEGSAVLIRAVEPLGGWEILRGNRPGLPDGQLTNGPAKLCKALGIDTSWNGHDLHMEPLRLQIRPSLKDEQIVQTTRIGISQAQDKPWRFYIRDNPYVSRLAK